ncbi:DoxX family protein [Streptomyces sp. NPDC052309]|uniref:DoxX family protein n=1 Tax=Streptomyces sp. NPDC052309 TaxID=3155421 RepID=UPI003441517B
MRNGTPASPLDGLLGRGTDHAIGLFRMVTGFLFACHGAATLFDVLGGAYGGTPAFGDWPSWWAAVIQLVGGGLVFAGVGTRAAAVVCSGSMAYAYFVEHQPEALFPIENGGEAAAMFCWSFLLIAALGPGRWALAPVLARSRRPADRTARGEQDEAATSAR